MDFLVRVTRFLCVASALVLVSESAAAVPARPVLLVLGDSLAAEYGLPRNTGWVRLLADRLATTAIDGRQYSVVNASISGETTSGGHTRLPALLKQHRPAVIVIELGANDALRGLPLELTRDNLKAMIAASRAAGSRVLLIGMRVPPNYGRAYADGFHATFVDIARTQKIALVPFLLEGFAEQFEYFQADRIHPNTKAQAVMLETVWSGLRPLLAARAP